jgi:hypothetical protein
LAVRENVALRGDNMPRKPSGNFNQKDYINKYVQDNIVYKRINFSRSNPDDMAISAWLDAQKDGEGISNYIKRLIMQDMKNSEKNF